MYLCCVCNWAIFGCLLCPGLILTVEVLLGLTLCRKGFRNSVDSSLCMSSEKELQQYSLHFVGHLLIYCNLNFKSSRTYITVQRDLSICEPCMSGLFTPPRDDTLNLRGPTGCTQTTLPFTCVRYSEAQGGLQPTHGLPHILEDIQHKIQRHFQSEFP